MVREIDFKLYLNKNSSKTLGFKNDDGTNYDLSNATSVLLRLYKDTQVPIDIAGTIDTINSTIAFLFTSATHTNELGSWEYVIEEVRVSETIVIGRGNITIEDYIPFSRSIEAFLRSELPANLAITTDYQNQRITYWRLLLQKAFEISDEDLNTESAWPVLVNALFAKLIVYDALMLAASGSFIQFMGGTYMDTNTIGGGGAVKAVETGPAKVEYYDAAASAKNAFSSSPGKLSMFETLTQSICELGRYLEVKLPMCASSNPIIIPKYYKNPNWDYPTLNDMDDITERQPSQG